MISYSITIVGNGNAVLLVLVDVCLGRLADPEFVFDGSDSERDVHVPDAHQPVSVLAEVDPHPMGSRNEIVRLPTCEVGRLRFARSVVTDAAVCTEASVGKLPVDIGLHQVELERRGRSPRRRQLDECRPDIAAEKEAVRKGNRAEQELRASVGGRRRPLGRKLGLAERSTVSGQKASAGRICMAHIAGAVLVPNHPSVGACRVRPGDQKESAR